VIKYLLEKGVNPNFHALFHSSIIDDVREKRFDLQRGDLLRLLLLHGYIYEYKYEYIDKETKL
jgi:hypothetical protein